MNLNFPFRISISFLLFFSIATSNLAAQGVTILAKPRVDERVELLSIVFRLAGAQEFSSTQFKRYTDNIERYFAAYKNHELISYIKKIRKENGIGYDAVMKMAVHLGPAPGFKPLVKLSDSVPEKRWKMEKAQEFIRLLGKFYKDSRADVFFKANADIYKEVSKRFLTIYDQLDLNWYKDFYGKSPKEKFIIINGVGNGGGNYGPDIFYKDGKREVYAIMGTWTIDSTGMARFDLRDYFPTLLHEFNHSFVNYLTDQNPSRFEKNGRVIYKAVQEQMSGQAYAGWQTMISEALVRAAVIKYMKDHSFDKQAIDREILEQLDRGFLWINELLIELEKYDQQRVRYPTLESYLPNIILAYHDYAQNISVYQNRFEQQRPKVTSIDEFANNSKNVDPVIHTITINFDRPLFGKGYSINLTDKGNNAFPKISKVSYSKDNTSIILETALEKGKEYEFELSGRSFKSVDQVPMKNFVVSFNTTP